MTRNRSPAFAGFLLLGPLVATTLAAQDQTSAFREALAASRGAPAATRGVNHTLLARAFDRADQRDSAAVHYLEAAALLPDVADWLALRAAGVLADSVARAGVYQRLRLPAAQARIPWTEAAALSRTGDRRGAANRYDLLAAPIQAARARMDAQPTTAELTALRGHLLALLTPRLGAADTRTVIAMLDERFGPFTPAEQLTIARRAAVTGNPARAVQGFSAARPNAGLSDADRLAWGMALAQLGRHPDAINMLAVVREPSVAGAAAYQRARSLLSRSGAAAALPVLRQVAIGWPDDTASASVALYLAGDLLADEGDWVGARSSFERVAERYPSTSYAARALLEVGTISWARGERVAAHQAFSQLAARYPQREEGSAGAYWAGRVDVARGDTAAAHQRWRELIARVPHSYYAMMAARRLGQAAWAPIGPVSPIGVSDALRAAMGRAALLDTLGMTTEQQFEFDHLGSEADSSIEQTIALAQALHDHGQVARGLGMAQRAFSRGAERTPALYRLLFPVPYAAAFHAQVEQRKLDPWLVAGLIKQESGFNPQARSGADARGLMQVLPSVGNQLARRLGIAGWNAARLYEPEISLTLGTQHLAEMLRQYPDPIRVLAAYNAGGTRVRRWENRPGVGDDPELFLEMIPYLETRNYVRRVLRNAEFYRALYGTGER
ncbi:MAG TPA: transglycosylase SLT domain-containing protein [Gemmatimonadales bacterium]|nr:transglycosylase SLT domain-containing protein [Gemmatimonadales bacterium]